MEISQLIACQDALLAALDARDVDAIQTASEALAKAVQGAKAKDVWHDGPELKAGIDHALRQNDAARMRVNIMSEWTQRRAAQLAEIRGQAPAHVYSRYGGSGV